MYPSGQKQITDRRIMAEKKKRNIVKFHKVPRINIGIVVFLAILIYMLYNVYQYFSVPRIAGYEVIPGSIAQDNTFTGVILREEEIFYTEKPGYINYYSKDASKVGVGSYVYSIDETGDFYQGIRQQDDKKLLEKEGFLEELEQTAENYMSSYSNAAFYQSYSFQSDVEALVVESLGAEALSSVDGVGNAPGLHVYQAAKPGIVVYNIDGLEGVTLENFSDDAFDASSHGKTNLATREQAASGEPAYKLITSELWTLLIPIEEELAWDLGNENNIQVEFKKDHSVAWGESNIITQGDKCYLALTFQDSAIRFATERYLEITLMRSDTNGLKIPNSALATMDCFKIPSEYLTKNDDGANCVKLEYKDEKGKKQKKLVPVTLRGEKRKEDTEEQDGKETKKETLVMYYFTSDTLKDGDTICHPETGKRRKLNDIISLKGVYNISRGYAIFRTVDILFQNQEYSIVDIGTDYGISPYDHIALDASTVTEHQIIH